MKKNQEGGWDATLKNDSPEFNIDITKEIKAPVQAIDGLARIFLENYGANINPDGLALINNIRAVCQDTIKFINEIPDYTLLNKLNPADEMIDFSGTIPEVINHDDVFGQQSIDKKFGWIYPSAEENMIIKCFKNQDDTVNNIFCMTVDNIYFVIDNLLIADIMVKKLYGNIIAAVYSHYGWLENFIAIQDFENAGYIHEGAENSARDFCCRKINYLKNIIRRFQPVVTDPLINEIIAYILHNIESDIKLKTISEKFYINHTYLSNNFAAKAGINYNDYVTLLKMSRARYLFKRTNLKAYEIGYQLGYHDINYFSKLFKKYYGQSPIEYRNADYIDYQI